MHKYFCVLSWGKAELLTWFDRYTSADEQNASVGFRISRFGNSGSLDRRYDMFPQYGYKDDNNFDLHRSTWLYRLRSSCIYFPNIPVIYQTFLNVTTTGTFLHRSYWIYIFFKAQNVNLINTNYLLGTLKKIYLFKAFY